MPAFDILGYFESHLERLRPSASGKHEGEMTAVCPGCGKWGKFYANRITGRFGCFACDFRGRSIVALVSKVEDIDWSTAAAYVFRNSVELPRRESLLTLGERVRLAGGRVEEAGRAPVDFDVPKKATPCWRDGRWRLPRYLKERGLKSRTARAWGLAFCSALFVQLPTREKPLYLKDRLFIPIECPAGRSWTARDMTGAQDPKYMNPPGADHSRLLIGWNMARLTGDLAIVEGPLDVMKWWQHDIPAVALGGKELHDAQLEQLMALSPETTITIALDPEEVAAPLKLAARLACHFRNIFIAKLPILDCKHCGGRGRGCTACKGSGKDFVDPGASTRAQAHAALNNSRRWNGERLHAAKAALERSRVALAYRW